MSTSAEARNVAVRAHGDQKYGVFPYIVHLDAVAEICQPYGDVAQTIAYLHDVVEDTDTTLQQVRNQFGDLVAECVSLLTDQPGANRKERKAKTYARLATVVGSTEIALVVKTADRLANVRTCVVDDNQQQWEVYEGEHLAFREAAFRQGLCPELWEELDALLGRWRPGSRK
ncbi:MAG TPA: HD domain-containing protein [Dongiaceae bacterium]|nr:HD domain-containing protein [Dongiaceae bacterium]